MKIPNNNPEDQYAYAGKHSWSVQRLWGLAKDLPVQEAPIDALSCFAKYDVTLRELVGHMKTALESDTSFPIILDEDGDIMDGRHRAMKLILEGAKTFKFVKFDENPRPCKILEDQ